MTKMSGCAERIFQARVMVLKVKSNDHLVKKRAMEFQKESAFNFFPINNCIFVFCCTCRVLRTHVLRIRIETDTQKRLETIAPPTLNVKFGKFSNCLSLFTGTACVQVRNAQ
jgi:hypothetical protein